MSVRVFVCVLFSQYSGVDRNTRHKTNFTCMSNDVQSPDISVEIISYCKGEQVNEGSMLLVQKFRNLGSILSRSRVHRLDNQWTLHRCSPSSCIAVIPPGGDCMLETRGKRAVHSNIRLRHISTTKSTTTTTIASNLWTC